MSERIIVAGQEIPRPEELRTEVRDLAVLLEHLPVPYPKWQQELLQLRVMLLLSKSIYQEYD